MAIDAEVQPSTQAVREKLKKATIAAEDQAQSEQAGTAMQDPANVISKKRSHEDIVEAGEEDDQARAPHHTRKRSRDSTAEVDEHDVKKRASSEIKREAAARPATPEAESAPAVEEVASPKTKKSRLQDEPTSKPGSGFSNTSATSPFGTATEQTSASTFASSSFSALSKSSTSGFSAIGKTSGGFGTGGSFATKPTETVGEKPSETQSESKSVFGGSLGAKSAFASSNGTTSGFGSSAFSTSGGLGSAFASKGGFGSLGGAGLSSFASGKSTSAFAAKPTKAFGAPAGEGEDDDDGEGDDAPDDSGIKSPLSVGTDEDKKDERFYEQELETGEEDEDVIFSGRAKLYTYSAGDDGIKQWKERGIGVVKLNKKRRAEGDSQAEAKPETSLARLLMRADGSHRVVLNSVIKKDITVTEPGGGPPTRGILMFMGTTTASSTIELLQLKLKQQLAVELYDKVKELQDGASSQV